MRRLRLSPLAYHRLTLAVVALVAVIIVTGAAVRLTGSGLGCPDWPTCAQGKVVAASNHHEAIESLNRTVTGLVSAAVVLAVLGSLLRVPRRRDLVWLSLGLVGGVIGQIVLGGLVVVFDLYPPLVQGHMIMSLLLVWCAVVLQHRSRPGPAPVDPTAVPAWGRRAGRWLVFAAGVVIVLGTVVTGSGPHPGSHEGQFVERMPFSVHDVARLHGIAVMLYLAATVVLAWQLLRSRAPGVLLRRAEVLLVVLVAQAGVGYAQYFAGVPALLVGIHVAGAVAVWIATLRLALALGGQPVREPVVVPADGVLVST